jgi:uncharacterized protein YjfI (DUF2170 family)
MITILEIQMSEKQGAILALLQKETDWTVDPEDKCLSITNDEGIDAFLFAGETQIIIETILFPADIVKDVPALDAHILRSHRIVPLSTVGISSINGKDYYVAFGELSVDSKNEVLIEEVEALFTNVPEFIELYSEHFTS